ncbi:hypothetical protein [Chromobacterium sp. LK11]|uniref:hypothetical protein n=1 Tax=Chromobacterium sp. LK11 TaxID=1628212 RepID=UPI0012E0D3B3|nr:hypothetical protein [Chromobacterium sp. LK11]
MEFQANSSFLRTTFRFVSADGRSLNLGSVLVYSVEKEWTFLPEGVGPSQNPGIGNLAIPSRQFGSSSNCIVTLDIDPVIVNNVPYASDGASLIFGIDGSNAHINIHKDGSMGVAGIYGATPDIVKWEYEINKVGGESTFYCKSKR